LQEVALDGSQACRPARTEAGIFRERGHGAASFCLCVVLPENAIEGMVKLPGSAAEKQRETTQRIGRRKPDLIDQSRSRRSSCFQLAPRGNAGKGAALENSLHPKRTVDH